MKSILLSIKPRFCELIASGEKTMEIRKNRPKIDVPFKVYIYETKTVYVSRSKENDMLVPIKQNMGKVIGEFVCDDITSYRMCMGVPEHLVREGAISFDEIWKYCNKGENDLYAWHISELVIYDKPKELSEFKKYDSECLWRFIRENNCKDIDNNECRDCHLQRPPQSWCYVEELEG